MAYLPDNWWMYMALQGMAGKGYGKGKGKGKGGWEQGWGVQNDYTKQAVPPYVGPNWRGVLNSELGKKLRRQLTKEDIVLSVRQDHRGYTVTLVCQAFSEPSYIGPTQITRALASQEAAKKALKSEFPEAFEAVGNGSVNAAVNPRIAAKAEAASGKGNSFSADGKSKLHQAVQMLLERSVGQGDIVYVTKKVAGKYVTTVTVLEVVATECIGGAALSEQAAENLAAMKLLDVLAPQVDQLMAEKKASGAKITKPKVKKPIDFERDSVVEKLKEISDLNKVWVGGVKATCTAQQLRKFFERAGPVLLAERLGKSSAVVAYKTSGPVAKAVNMFNDQSLDGSTIKVDAWSASD